MKSVSFVGGALIQRKTEMNKTVVCKTFNQGAISKLLPRELFVDATRSVSVVLGEKDNKSVGILIFNS